MAASTLLLTLSTLLLIPLTYLLVNTIRFLKSLHRKTKAVLEWPGSERHWFWGTLLEQPLFDPKVRATGYLDAQIDFSIKHCAKFPFGFYAFYTSLRPIVSLNHPKHMREIFKKSDPKPLGFGQASYNFLRPWLGDGLLLAGGKKWARNRRLLTPAFHFDILKPYIDVYNNAVVTLLDKMDTHATDGTSFEVCKHISLCTLEILLECAFSQKPNYQIEGGRDQYVHTVRDLTLSIVDRLSNPIYTFDFLYQRSRRGRKFIKDCDFVHKIADDVIFKRRQEIGTSKTPSDRKYLDFLDILLSAHDDNGNGLTDLEIRDEVDTFLFEGHDTTASGLTWMLYSLAKYPEHQKKVQEELDAILNAKGSDTVEWDDLGKMKYLSLCIKESLRIYPPVFVVSRVMENDTEIDGRVIPAGVQVDLFIYGLHHNPQVWEDHMEFKPERFLPENIQKNDPFAFLPFAAGPRNCIGQNFAMNEMKVILARILRKFSLTLDPDHEVHYAQEVLLKPANDIKMKVKRRK
ncbi:cytochrome P450 4F2-like [Amphiura filiformis]|uniref:cytochrome P450 4F2-like n=1 Tax=Amphiura filiformis TaxID=82378 RepID=UPI003B220212